jgi:anionic cell wall polymer biosynthesis LytR-Cps2A-Psr (LCP) family protein
MTLAAVVGVLGIGAGVLATLYLSWVTQALQDVKRIETVADYPGRPSAATTASEAPVNFLVVALDPGNLDPDNTVLAAFVAHLNGDHTALALISIPSSALLPAASGRTVNSVFLAEGLPGLTRDVEQAFGVRMEHGLVIDVAAAMDVVGAVNGVTFDNPSPVTVGAHTWQAGSMTLSDREALAYARAAAAGPDADIEAAEHLSALFTATIKELSEPRVLTNPMTFRQVTIEFGEATCLDAQSSVTDLQSLVADIRLQHVISLALPLADHPETTAGPSRGGSGDASTTAPVGTSTSHPVGTSTSSPASSAASATAHPVDASALAGLAEQLHADAVTAR